MTYLHEIFDTKCHAEAAQEQPEEEKKDAPRPSSPLGRRLTDLFSKIPKKDKKSGNDNTEKTTQEEQQEEAEVEEQQKEEAAEPQASTAAEETPAAATATPAPAAVATA